MKNNVLIIAGYYIPGVKGGGPIQSIKNLVDNLSEEYNFYILANDRDLGDNTPYSITMDQWVKNENSHVYYTDISKLTIKKIRQITKKIDFDVIYLNSFFSFKLSIMPYLLWHYNFIETKKIVIAPRGNFSDGALGLKKIKKQIYIKLAKFLKLYKDVEWHATNEIEMKQIKDTIDYIDTTKIYIANNLTRNYASKIYNATKFKKINELNLIYVARIHPVKNLLQILNILQDIDFGSIRFNIYGPIEDHQYWLECQRIISKLGNNIKVEYYGATANDTVVKAFSENHVFILLTLGENFGHSINEALIEGCPVIISDKTPWRNLEKNEVGYDLSLNKHREIKNAISNFIKMDESVYREKSQSAFYYAKTKSNVEEEKQKYNELFNT